MNRPFFWKDNGILSSFLIPISFIYYSISKLHYYLKKKYISDIPIVSVGSPLIGGGGKTPVVIAILNFLIANQKNPCALAKGYKGSIKIPTLINNKHSVKDVGDEPLLISKTIDTYVSKKRKDALEVIKNNNYNFVVMDDGFRDISILNKVNLLVIDGNTKLDNNRPFPSGELLGITRKTIEISDAVILLNDNRIPQKIKNEIEALNKIKINTSINYVFRHSSVRDRIAFCGIGVPKKFFASLEDLGTNVIEKITFSNHHYYSRNDVYSLIKISRKFDKYTLITTAKDYVRFNDINDPKRELREIIDVLDMEVRFEDVECLKKFL